MTGAAENTEFELQGFPVHQEASDLRAREPVEILATQFVEEIRNGGSPSVEQYARRYSRHATVIRESFPVLQLLEQARMQNEAASIRRNMPEAFPFTKLGNFELLCELGRGGMGVVFQARDISSNHIVAVKLLPWRVAVVPEWQRRFEEEARTTARLRHRNIVPVFRFGQEHGYCYYVMQFVNGVGLDVIIERLGEVDGVLYQDEIRRQEENKPEGFISSMSLPALQTQQDIDKAVADVRRRKLTRNSWKSFTQIAIQTAQALRYAHSQKILHNDIKPANLLLDSDGRVWVTDFGLSQPIEPSNAQSPARLMGTLRFMAPERLSGNHDARSDIYSFGITLYELLTLKPAFEARNEDEMLHQVLNETPLSPWQRNPDVPRGLDTIVQNCIAKNPDERYPTADELLTDLLRFSRDERVNSLRRSRFTSFIHRVGRRS
ncbi:MAG: serine/threonine protein kinase [Planctomycetaceae bacterium]|nr:serine/threonine protein kinase [Planctomycetaceae bacterium]